MVYIKPKRKRATGTFIKAKLIYNKVVPSIRFMHI